MGAVSGVVRDGRREMSDGFLLGPIHALARSEGECELLFRVFRGTLILESEDECKLSDGEFDVSVQSADGRSSLHGLAPPSGCRLNWSIMSLSDGERDEGRQTNWLSPPPFFPTLAMGPQRNRYKSPLLMRTVNLLLQRRTDRRRPHMGYGASLASDRQNTH